MIINYPLLGIAILLLWYPRQFLRLGGFAIGSKHRSRRKRHRESDPSQIREPGDPAVWLTEEIAKGRNYIDFFRAAIGSIAVVGGIEGIDSCLMPDPQAIDAWTGGVLVIRVLILLVAIIIQSVRYETHFGLFAPIFFLSGLSIGLCGWETAVFAMVLVWTINLALPNPTGFLAAYAVLIGLFGLLFRSLGDPMIYIAPSLFFLPVLISLLTRRRLMTFSRKTKHVQ